VNHTPHRQYRWSKVSGQSCCSRSRAVMHRPDTPVAKAFSIKKISGCHEPEFAVSPLQVGPYRLDHRVVMAPLTRMRAERSSFAPRVLNAEYYGQRATAGGLIIAEASPVAATGRGNPATPGIYSDQQVEGWRKVVDAVHGKGGFIFLQLWHVGRVSHSSLQPGGMLPVAPSAVPITGEGMLAMTRHRASRSLTRRRARWRRRRSPM
jgi:2,4-dienoyl-CoA reductase-like NADH-dependent reductase (Old Yellow Enzyme family)